jgi:glutathione S-transferase
MSMPRLTYFSARGIAELPRMLLAEAGVEYEEVHVGVYHPTEKTAEFLALKDAGKLAFDQLPLWEERDGFAVVQSDAIVRHIARTRSLYGHDEREMAGCDMLLEAVKDVRGELRRLQGVPAEERASMRETLVDAVLPRWLGYFDKWLEKNGDRGYLVGAGVTCADISLFGLLETLADNDMGRAVGFFPRLMAFEERMRHRPRVAA